MDFENKQNEELNLTTNKKIKKIKKNKKNKLEDKGPRGTKRKSYTLTNYISDMLIEYSIREDRNLSNSINKILDKSLTEYFKENQEQ